VIRQGRKVLYVRKRKMFQEKKGYIGRIQRASFEGGGSELFLRGRKGGMKFLFFWEHQRGGGNTFPWQESRERRGNTR